MDLNWWLVFWSKFIGGVLFIVFGLMLGCEGFSIQLGVVMVKGVLVFFKFSEMESSSLIVSGVVVGLVVVFNVLMVGFLFVVEEVYY